MTPTKISTLRFLDCHGLELHGDSFSPATCLRVLDLSECLIQSLPSSIGQLKQLRFLHAPGIHDQMIPNCITKFPELNYLCSYISALPESIGDMKGLMHLDLSGCRGIVELPVSFAELKQLVHLDLSFCPVSISETFGGFTKLQHLNLSGIFREVLNRTGLAKVIGNLMKLRYLNLSHSMKVMAPSEDQMDSLLGSISTLTNIEHLDLSLNGFSIIPESFGNLNKLHTLDIRGCSNIKKLPRSIVYLKALNVERLVTLDEYVSFNIISLPHFVVHASSQRVRSNIVLLQHTHPDELTIDKLENVKSAEEAQSINLIKKQKIKRLTFQWTVAVRRFVDDKEVLEKLVPPSSVRMVSISGYKSVSLPDWLMGTRHYLPDLEAIELCDFPKCKNLPPLGQLPNLRSLNICRMESLEDWDTAFTGGVEGEDELMFPMLFQLSITQCAKLKLNRNSRKLTQLRGLHLSECRSMTSIPQWLGELTHLVIEHCDGIRSLPDNRKQLDKLEYLTIRGCPSFMQWSGKLTSLSKLVIEHCESITSLPQWLGEVSSLRGIEIMSCEGIRFLPDSIQQLDKLDYLRIEGCPTLREWCESGDNKMKLADMTEEFVRDAEENITVYRILKTNNSLVTASGSNINDKGKKPMNSEETIDWTAEDPMYHY